MDQAALDQKSKFLMRLRCAVRLTSLEKPLSALKCAQCGLVNFATATQCKRCRTPFVQERFVSSRRTCAGHRSGGRLRVAAAAIGGKPGAGVWRDKANLVMSKERACRTAASSVTSQRTGG